MPYSVFVSHTEMDAELAAAVYAQIQSAFNRQIPVQFAREHIESGAQWKSWIRDNLESSNAVVSLFTPESAGKPWLYVEWAPFWVRDREFYILLSGGVKREDLIEAMWDSQMVDLHDPASVHKFLRTLGRKVESPPDEAALGGLAAAFTAAVEQGRQADLARSIERFAPASVPLPEDDREKRRILEYFHRRGATDVFRQKFRTIGNDAFKASMTLWLLKQNDPDLAALVCEDIRGGDHVRDVAMAMVHAGLDRSPQLERVLGCIKAAELRNFALNLVDAGMAGTDLLQDVVGRIANAAELRTVGLPLVRRSEFTLPVFGMIVERIKARGSFAPLGDLADEFVSHGHASAPQFLAIMDVLAEKRPQRTGAVIQKLEEGEPELAAALRERYRGKLDGPDADT